MTRACAPLRSLPPSLPWRIARSSRAPALVRDGAGFTVVEAATVLAVLAVVVTLAVPSLRAYADRQRLDGAAATLAADLLQARMEAVVRQEAVRVSTLDDGADGHCVAVHTGPSSGCTCRATRTPAAACAHDALLLRHLHLRAADRVRVAATAPSLQFDPQLGTCTPTGSFVLSAPNGDAVHHIVNVMGRVRSCSPAGRVSGHVAC